MTTSSSRSGTRSCSPASPPSFAVRARPSRLRDRYEDGNVTINYALRQVTARGRPVPLTPLEFRLLVTLTRHPRQVLSREQLLELVWADPFAVSKDAVRLYVGYLRRKLDGIRIETVRGFGYRYEP